MTKTLKQILRSAAMAGLLVAAMLLTQADVRHNPVAYVAGYWPQLLASYVIVAVLCWMVDAAFTECFKGDGPSRLQRIKLALVLGIAASLTLVAFYYDWKYDHAPGVDNGPFVVDLAKGWPIYMIYVAVFSFFEILAYLVVKLIVGEVARLVRVARKSSIRS